MTRPCGPFRARYQPLKTSYLPKIQVMVAREFSHPGKGLVLAAKGGHNDEGHNHNDVGNRRRLRERSTGVD